MSRSVAGLAKALFQRFTKKTPTPNANRFRPALEQCEDRMNPTPVVTASWVADAHEGGSAGTLRLTRTETTGFLSVNYSFSGTASSFSDYTSSPLIASFASGQPTTDITITAVNDSTSEPTETVVLTLNSGSGYTVGSPASATVNILDNDAQVVSVAQVDDATEGGTDGKFTFTRIGDLSSSLTANFSVSGTATSGTDFTSLGTTVTFAANSATVDKSVTALHDGVDDDGETVSVTVGTGTGYSVGSPSSATLTINNVPDLLPDAYDGMATTDVNVAVNVSVLDFASDLDGDAFSLTGVTDGDHGSVTINMDGTVTYTPDADFVGDDSFTYTIGDGFGNHSTGTVSVTVTAPIAAPTSLWTATNTPINFDARDLAIDPDEDELSVTAVTQGDHGTVTIELDGTVTYTPDTSFSGDDSFTYTVEDGDGNEATQTIMVTVGATDPVAVNDEVTTATNTAKDVTITDIAFAPSGGSVTVTAITQGTHGTVVNNNDGTVTYTPNTGYTGTDSFTYTITDAASHTATATITITVGPAASTPADDIEATLSDVLDDLENADDDTPDRLEDAVPDLTTAITDYVSSAATYIASNRIESNGSNLSFKEFFTQLDAYKEASNTYNTLLGIESILNNVLFANKALIEELNRQLQLAKTAANPDKALILDLSGKLLLLYSAQASLYADVYVPLSKELRASYEETLLMYRTLRTASVPGPWLQQFLSRPSSPANRDLLNYIPKKD